MGVESEGEGGRGPERAGPRARPDPHPMSPSPGGATFPPRLRDRPGAP